MINFKEYIHYLNRNRTLVRKRYISLYRTIFRNKSRRILEVGTYNGENALQMIQTAAIHFPVGEIEYFGFDLFELLTDEKLKAEASLRPPCISEVRQKLENTRARITLYQGDTKDILPKIKNKLGQMDFIFIDGGHSVETISSDWNCIKDLLTKKTVVVFDDYYTNASPELNGVGCQNIINNLSRDLYETELLKPMDIFIREWGKLEINFAKVTKKGRKASCNLLSDILISIEPTLQGLVSLAGFLKQLMKKAVKCMFRTVGLEIRKLPKESPEMHRVPEFNSHLWDNNNGFLELYEEIKNHTLVPVERCFMLYQLTKYAGCLKGSIAEVGVYKGGTAKLLAKSFKDKTFHLFDTFSGMPEANQSLDIHKKGDFSDTSLEDVKFFLRDCDYITFHKGLFPETTKPVEEELFCFVYVDVDIYQSVKDCLEFFYSRMVPGGVILFDDYEVRDCSGVKKAINEFFDNRNIRERPILLPTYQCLLVKL